MKPGESLWWASDSDIDNTAAPATVRLWNVLTCKEKTMYTVRGYAMFPEILSDSGTKKYQRYALWLATNCGIINTNIRDQFSAGGQVEVVTRHRVLKKMPAAYGRINANRTMIIETILSTNEEILKDYWNCNEIAENRILQWCQLAANNKQNVDVIRAIMDI